MDLKKDLSQLIQGDICDDSATLDTYSRDASLFEIRPKVIVAPKNVEDIKKLVEYVNNRSDDKISLTARSAATDMTGGPLNESIIVDMAKHLNNLKEIDKDYAVTEPGICYRNFEKETLKHNLLLPSYPASREICTVGGMVANNSGGEKSLTYGKTISYVKQLKVVLRDGNEYTLKPLNRTELDAKLKQTDFEGEIYQKTLDLLEKNYEILQKAKPDVSKNSAGYYLWEIWNKEVFDLTKLFVGSQGTLGIITEIVFKLVEPKPHSKLLVIFLKDLKPLAKVINTVLKYNPQSFESFDDKTLKLAIRFLPDLIKMMGAKNIWSLMWQFAPELKIVLTSGIPRLILMAEFADYTETAIDEQMKKAQKDLKSFRIPTHITKTKQEAQKYWTIRRESFNLLRCHIKGKRTAPFIDDMIVKPEYLPEFLPRVEKILKPYNLLCTIAGHAGDGNFHIIPLVNPSDPKLKNIIPELSKKIYDLVLEYHGSITAEHNDGLIRSPFLEQMYGPVVYDLFKQTKLIFDPKNIFNPGKKVNSTFDYAMNHLRNK